MVQHISIDEIMDYSKCPMYYFLKHKKKMSTDKIDIIEKYEEDILKVMYYSFYKLQENDLIRIEDIKAMWGRLWIKDKRKNNIVFTDSYMHKDTYNNKRVKGLESLLKFRDFLSNNMGYPILINQEYKIRIGDIILSGKFDLVREVVNSNGEKEIQTCMFISDRDVPKITQKYDLKFHSDALAIQGMVDEKLKISHMIHYFEKGKSIVKKHNLMNNEMFTHQVKTIANLIKNEIYFMSVTDNCQKCIYSDLCANKSNTMQSLVKLDEGEN